MAAAQAAAEAALRETSSRQQGDNQSLNDPALVAGLLQGALQEDSIDEQYGAQHLLNEIVGYQRIMAQRDQQPVAPSPEPQLPQGETKHYMTIAEDGELSCP